MDACSRARHWLSTGLLTLGLLAAAGGFVSHTGASAAAAGEELMLVNVKTGKCLTIAGGVSTDNNVQAVQFDCDSDPSRRWILTPGSGADVYQVRNVQTTKCLTIAGESIRRTTSRPSSSTATATLPAPGESWT